jgi:membrane fusion protein, macrolide-specific efflux system
MMLYVFGYAIAVASALSVVGLCAERFARLHRLPRRAGWAAAMLLSVLLPVAMIYLAQPAEIRNVSVPVADLDDPYLNPEPADFAESPAAHLPAQALPSAASQSAPAAPSAKLATGSTWKLPRPSDTLFITMWMATSSVLALYLLGANLLLRRRIKGWHNATVQDHKVLISEVTGPALLGAFSPRIVVPRWLLLQPHGTQALILQHEQQHVLARDALLIMAGLVAIVAVPWNLPLWWQWRRMRQAIELDCDARVLGAGAEANAYAEVLLAITQRSTRIPAGALAMSEPVHALERRIANLLPDAIRYARLQTVAVLLLAAAGAGAALALEAPALPGRTSSAPMAPRAVESAPAVQTPAKEPASFKEGEYITAAVTRGDIEDLVTSTGTLTPRDSVDVGAQVSGRIEKLHVVVGDVVRQGDLLAEIDSSTAIDKVDGLRAQLLIAEINLNTQESNLEKAGRDLKRLENLPLTDATTQEARFNAETAFKNAERSVITAKAQIEVAKANLRIEERNLGYTRITAPIGGTVMKIQVKQGQRVDATQNVPVVMQIANLSTMTVAAEVSEADVVKLYKGIAVYFTTPGANGRRWHGELKRVEPTPKVRNGVVTYNALFDVQSDGGRLIPRMTAQVYFVSAEARNVLRVPMAALRQGQQLGGGGFSGQRPNFGQIGAGASGSAARGLQRLNRTVIVRKADGTLEARQVVVGVTDRVHGEVLEGLNEGEEVVVGKHEAEAAAAGK